MMCKLLAIALALRGSAAESSLNATRALLSSRLSKPDPTCAKGIEATGPNGAVICCTGGCDKKHGGCGDTVHCDSPKPWKDQKARKHCCIQEITQSQKFCSTYSAPCIISLAPGPAPPPGPRPAPPPRRRASTPRRRDPSPSPSPSPSPGPWPNNIASKATWTCLDLPGENDKNGQQLWMWECNGGNSQRFTQFNGQIVYSGRDGVADEDRPCLDAGDMWTDGMPIQLWQCNGQPQQQWGVDSDVGSVYLSESADASRCLDLAGGSAALGAAVQVWECTGFDNQQWWWS